jgi:hypothetical protein
MSVGTAPKEAKERLRPALAPLNVEKTMTAPVTVIVGYDMKFYEQLAKLFPQSPGMSSCSGVILTWSRPPPSGIPACRVRT